MDRRSNDHTPGPEPRSRHRSRREPRRRNRKRILALLVLAIGAVLALDAWLCPRLPRFLERWPAPDSGFTPWEPLAPGVDYARANLSHPRLMKCHALRIDLTQPGLRVKVAGDPDAAGGGMKARWTTSFLRRHGLTVAINATPFRPDVVLPGRAVRPTGLVVKDGEQISPPAPNLDALVLDRNGPPRFQRSQRLEPDAFEVAGGFVVTLADGVNRGEAGLIDAVTSVGLSPDRRWMFWLVVDGRQPDYSEGARGTDAADLMKLLGASDAMLLDGGGSSTLAARTGWAGARVLNRPRSPVISGLQRPVACVLGVRLDP
ncbi:MAG: phosphodiester glycosidase family protein [Limisphaerales bacterium]